MPISIAARAEFRCQQKRKEHLLAHVGSLVLGVEAADEAGMACYLGLAHVDIDLGTVHTQVGLVAGVTDEQVAMMM